MTENHSLWGGRFEGSHETVDPLMDKLNRSLPFDYRLGQADVEGSMAYSAGLAKSGLLSSEEAATMQRGLNILLEEWTPRDGDNTLPSIAIGTDEDVHTANERRLGELIGPRIAGKLHTGRSRNDQCATDLRLWLKSTLQTVKSEMLRFLRITAFRAEKDIDVLMPGYTHVQRAQPIRWSHWVLSHAETIRRDCERIGEIMKRVDVSPLGSGALAGNPLGIDRMYLASELGFADCTRNSMDAVSDRDYVIETLFAASLCMIHLSRFAEDLIMWSSSEFGFVQLSETYSTGSSIMPQKKNPDSLELLRGKSGRVFGSLTGLMMVLKGLPSTYNKDLQEDKEPLFDAMDTLIPSLSIAGSVLETLSINNEKMKSALHTEMLATDVAYYLVRKAVPFRVAHEIAGKVVRKSEELKCQLSEIPLDVMKSLHEQFGSDVSSIWDFEASVDQYNVIGGTARESVLDQVRLLLEWTESQH